MPASCWSITRQRSGRDVGASATPSYSRAKSTNWRGARTARATSGFWAHSRWPTRSRAWKPTPNAASPATPISPRYEDTDEGTAAEGPGIRGDERQLVARRPASFSADRLLHQRAGQQEFADCRAERLAARER